MSYVQLTREEFEGWLSDIGFGPGKRQLKPGRGGVYQLFLSPIVAIEINSTTGSQDQVMGRGKASMSVKLVSRINGRTLNKKAQGQNYFARTLNWRENWKKGVDRMRDTYIKAKDFYDTLGAIEDYDAYQQENLALIQGVPGWESNSFLLDLVTRLRKGGVLSPKQRDAVFRMAEESSRDPGTEDSRLPLLRDLYRAARRAGDSWTMEFTLSLAKQIQAGRKELSPKQDQILKDKLKQFRVKTGSKTLGQLADEVLLALSTLQ